MDWIGLDFEVGKPVQSGLDFHWIKTSGLDLHWIKTSGLNYPVDWICIGLSTRYPIKSSGYFYL